MERSSRRKSITMLLALVVAAIPGAAASATETPPARGAPGSGGPASEQHRIAAGKCTGHESTRTPPSEIRVLVHAEHDAAGWGVEGTELGVRTVPFRSYVEDVLPAEWPASWPEESLRAGAIAVQNYAWYWTKNWRGGEFKGECFDVDDSITYQRYIPGGSTTSSSLAVETTWGRSVHKGGKLFSTGYRATLTGNEHEDCGAGRAERPDLLSQWGSRACAEQGRSGEEIVRTYYPGVDVR